MKTSLTIIVLALIASYATAKKDNVVLKKSKGSITFVVDKDLPAPKQDFAMLDDQDIARQIVDAIQIPRELHHVVKTSFEGLRLSYMGKDNFFKCMVHAYADHRPLVLTPDMVWLIISQGFSRCVNTNSEKMRDKLVRHQGKMKILVNSNNNMLLPEPDADWSRLLNDFSDSIAKHTKGELADLMIANFTTTGITERIASQISLMDVVKEYFLYLNGSLACGIPSITLKGTPEDWQKVLDKACALKEYDMEEWVSDLEPILKEFVEASKGNPNPLFWQSIVKKRRVDQMKTDKRTCLPSSPNSTYLDGWFLKFFPNAFGETKDSVLWNSSMPEEMVRVSFQQVLFDPVTHDVVKTVPMELWAGFVGVEEDTKTRALMPKIGWLGRIADEEAEEIARLKEKDRYGGGLSFYMGNLTKHKKVPEILSHLTHIRYLNLEFWRIPVDIPTWLDNIIIDKLIIQGEMTDEEEARLRQRFPKAIIKNDNKEKRNELPIPITYSPD